MSKDADTLLALHKAGVEISRNRNFELFQKPENRRALSLQRRLDMVAQTLRTYSARGELGLALGHRQDRFELAWTIPSLSATCRLRLDPQELKLLLRQPEIAGIFAQAGIEVDPR